MSQSMCPLPAEAKDESVMVLEAPPSASQRQSKSQTSLKGTQENPMEVDGPPEASASGCEGERPNSTTSCSIPDEAATMNRASTSPCDGKRLRDGSCAAAREGSKSNSREASATSSHHCSAGGDNGEDGGVDGLDSFRATSRFKTWRKHARDLYQTMLHMETHWPSACCQLLPVMSEDAIPPTLKDTDIDATGTCQQTMICGTKTGGAEQNYLQLVSLTLPTNVSLLDKSAFDPDIGEIGGFGSHPKATGMLVGYRFFHDGDVLSARYMPINPNVIATASSNGSVYLFDPSTISKTEPPNKEPRPLVPLYPGDEEAEMSAEFRTKVREDRKRYFEALKRQQRWDKLRGASQHRLLLSGNRGVGYTIDWNTVPDASLICGSEGVVSLWRVGAISRDAGNEINTTASFTVDGEGVDAIINDCRFSWHSPDLFFAVTEGGALLQGDVRDAAAGKGPMQRLDTPAWGIRSTLNCVALSPYDSNVAACGDGDGIVRVFDMRQLGAGPVSATQLHAPGSYVSQLQWCPHAKHLLLSGGEDGMCCVVDVHKAAADSPLAPLLFKHAGHTELIYDACWCWQPQYAGLIVTCDPNAVTVWKARNRFWPADESSL